jgi:hypothetical protein
MAAMMTQTIVWAYKRIGESSQDQGERIWVMKGENSEKGGQRRR